MTTFALSPGEVVLRLRAARIIPVIVIDDANHAVSLARALTGGGLSCVEITFRTAQAADALRRMTDEVPDVFAGAGTVLTPVQAAAARDAGARFVVAPGFNPRVVDYCQQHGIPVFPGVATPTEVERVLETGITTMKFFPAEPIGGLPFLKAIAAAYGDVDFIPTGGVNAANVARYLAYSRVVACGGSWMAPSDWIDGRQFDRIRDEARRAADIARHASPAVVA